MQTGSGIKVSGFMSVSSVSEFLVDRVFGNFIQVMLPHIEGIMGGKRSVSCSFFRNVRKTGEDEAKAIGAFRVCV